MNFEVDEMISYSQVLAESVSDSNLFDYLQSEKSTATETLSQSAEKDFHQRIPPLMDIYMGNQRIEYQSKEHLQTKGMNHPIMEICHGGYLVGNLVLLAFKFDAPEERSNGLVDSIRSEASLTMEQISTQISSDDSIIGKVFSGLQDQLQEVEPVTPNFDETIQEVTNSLEEMQFEGKCFDQDGTRIFKVAGSNEVKNKLKELIEMRAKEKLRGKQPNKDQYSKLLTQEKSYLSKNFPKKLGDQFCYKLGRCKSIDAIKSFLKDKTSWQGINKLLSGEEKIEGMTTQAFNKTFIKFLSTYQISSITKSKIKDPLSIVSYKILTLELKEAARRIEDYLISSGIKSYYLSIIKVSPAIKIQVVPLQTGV